MAINETSDRDHTGMESMLGKALRHINDGEIDPATIWRGMKQIGNLVWCSSEGILEVNPIIEGYRSVPDLIRAEYTLMPETLLKRLREMRVCLYDFPILSKLEVFVTPRDHLMPTRYFHRDREIKNKYCVIASFTGPTFETTKAINPREYGLPNNGFYHKDHGLMVPFREDPYLRKGAVAVKTTGEIELWTDEQKKGKTAVDFADYRAVFGTSHYFSPEDVATAHHGEAPKDRNHLSYLMLYATGRATRLCYAISEGMITRQTMLCILNHYVHTQKGDFLGAGELEYSNASCVIIGRGREKEEIVDGGKGFGLTRTHYLIVDPHQK